MTTLLTLEDVRSYYGPVEALHGVSLTVKSGEIVAILGANGAGKTTTMRAISRTVRTTGRIEFLGEDVTRHSTERMAHSGLGHVPEGRGTFVGLSVEENLRLGLLARPKDLRGESDADLASIFRLFPVLEEMRARTADTLSGGQQQILAIARALLGRPQLLMLDEMSLGLAPKVTGEIFGLLKELREEWNLAILLAEQNVQLSLDAANRAYVLDSGEVVAHGTPSELARSNAVENAYLGG